MTIAVAVRTGSAVVFAADSKVTTTGIAGVKPDGSPLWVEQTYDHAIKLVCDLSNVVMCMVAGHANIGRIAAMDLMSSRGFPGWSDQATQDGDIAKLVDEMVARKREFWETQKTTEDKWPGPTLLIAAPGPDRMTPRAWRIDLNGPGAVTAEILQGAGVRLEGAYDEVFGLLYGFHSEVAYGAALQMNQAGGSTGRSAEIETPVPPGKDQLLDDAHPRRYAFCSLRGHGSDPDGSVPSGDAGMWGPDRPHGAPDGAAA
ncbi:MAG TPA: hypothetical protein VL948_14185 [Verrucomicrobiae bacterium]|jgi:hypothetical protein|nr:hypothetical protein [Verrucomicrobiae bacterium]